MNDPHLRPSRRRNIGRTLLYGAVAAGVAALAGVLPELEAGAQGAPVVSKEIPAGHPAGPAGPAKGPAERPARHSAENPRARTGRPGCGLQPSDDESCWRPAKAGVRARARCAPADLASDPWQESSRATGKPLRSNPRWTLSPVAEAGNRRYGWDDPRPAGYWPLGGPVDEPWAESLATLTANLRWACENVRDLPPDLQGRLGDPAVYDMELHPREVYDLVFLGGARELHEEIKKARKAAGETAAATRSRRDAVAEFTVRPPAPRVGEEVVFLAADQGPGVTYRWLVDGIRRSGPEFRWTPTETKDVKVRLEIRRGAQRDTELRTLTIAPAGPDPAGPRRHRPSRASTGRLDLEIHAV